MQMRTTFIANQVSIALLDSCSAGSDAMSVAAQASISLPGATKLVALPLLLPQCSHSHYLPDNPQEAPASCPSHQHSKVTAGLQLHYITTVHACIMLAASCAFIAAIHMAAGAPNMDACDHKACLHTSWQ